MKNNMIQCQHNCGYIVCISGECAVAANIENRNLSLPKLCRAFDGFGCMEMMPTKKLSAQIVAHEIAQVWSSANNWRRFLFFFFFSFQVLWLFFLCLATVCWYKFFFACFQCWAHSRTFFSHNSLPELSLVRNACAQNFIAPLGKMQRKTNALLVCTHNENGNRRFKAQVHVCMMFAKLVMHLLNNVESTSC